MALTVSTIAARAMVLAPDLSSTLLAVDYQAEVSAAVLRLSRHEPQELYVDITGDGSSTTHDLTGWLRTHQAFRAEYPIDDTDLELASWAVVRKGAGWALSVSEVVPSGDDLRLWYRANHTSNGTTTTVDDTLLEPVARFCAALVLRRFAARFLHSRRSETLGGSELVDLRTGVKEAMDLAKLLDREALELLGIVEDDAVSSSGAAGATSGEVGIAVVTPPWGSIGL